MYSIIIKNIHCRIVHHGKELSDIAQSRLWRKSSLILSKERLLSVILQNLKSDVISIRTKSLKALSDIASVDDSTLGNEKVKGAISGLLVDLSKSVREAAVELLGMFVVSDKDGSLLIEYKDSLLNRVLV
jgi:hypothetical protein